MHKKEESMFAKNTAEIIFKVNQKAVYTLTNGKDIAKGNITKTDLVFAGYCIMNEFGKIYYANAEKINFISNEELLIILKSLIGSPAKAKIIYYTLDGDYFINTVLPEIPPIIFHGTVIQMGAEVVNSYSRRFAPAIYLSFYVPFIERFIRIDKPFFSQHIINKEQYDVLLSEVKQNIERNRSMFLELISRNFDLSFEKYAGEVIENIPKNVFKRIKSDSDSKRKLAINQHPELYKAIHASYPFSLLVSSAIEADLWSLTNYTHARIWQHKIFNNLLNYNLGTHYADNKQS